MAGIRVDLKRGLTLGGWAAGAEWLRRTNGADGRSLADEPLNRCEAHVAAVQDHYDLMCFPTEQPTVYLYGDVQAAEDGEHDVIRVDAVAQELTELLDRNWAR